MRRWLLVVMAVCWCGEHVSETNAQSSEITRTPVELDIDGQRVKALLSPDENFVVWATRDNNDLEIMLANADGTGVRQLTDNRAIDYAPDWLPDSQRIVFCSTRSGMHQIHRMSIEGGQVEQLTDEEFGCRLPRTNSRGDLAYQQMTEAPRGKAQPAAVVVTIGDTQKQLVTSDYINDFVWNAGGTWIAIATVDKLHFIDPESEEKISITLHEQDERLHAHAPGDLHWSPDGDAVACRIRFLGGRMGDVEIFGDKQVFLISTTGDFEYFDNLEEAQAEHDWIR